MRIGTGILEPLQVERLERLRQADRGLDIEAEVAVEGDLGVGPGDLAHDSQALVGQPHLVAPHLAVPRVAVHLGRDPLGIELEVAEAVGRDALGERAPGPEIARVGDAAAIEVDPDPIAERTAEQVVDGRPEDLAGEVAEGHLDAAHGPGSRPVDGRGRAHLGVVRWQAARQHRADERPDRQRVTADQPLACIRDGLAVAHEVAGLAQPVHAGIGVDPDQQHVPGPLDPAHAVRVGAVQEHRSDVGDLGHAALRSRRRSGGRCDREREVDGSTGLRRQLRGLGHLDRRPAVRAADGRRRSRRATSR